MTQITAIYTMLAASQEFQHWNIQVILQTPTLCRCRVWRHWYPGWSRIINSVMQPKSMDSPAASLMGHSVILRSAPMVQHIRIQRPRQRLMELLIMEMALPNSILTRPTPRLPLRARRSQFISSIVLILLQLDQAVPRRNVLAA